MAIHYDRETGRLNKGSRFTCIHERLEVQMWRIYPKMYRVSENGHPYFLPIRLLSGVYDFGMDLVYIKRYVRKQ